jgi:soluble P-type ATPase
MTLHVSIPGGEDLLLEHLVLDVNGTLSDRGKPIAAALHAVERLRDILELHIVSADTFGTGEQLAASISAKFRRVEFGQDKLAYVEALGPKQCIAVGNGRNDASASTRGLVSNVVRSGPLTCARSAGPGLCVSGTPDLLAHGWLRFLALW